MAKVFRKNERGGEGPSRRSGWRLRRDRRRLSGPISEDGRAHIATERHGRDWGRRPGAGPRESVFARGARAHWILFGARRPARARTGVRRPAPPERTRGAGSGRTFQGLLFLVPWGAHGAPLRRSVERNSCRRP